MDPHSARVCGPGARCRRVTCGAARGDGALSWLDPYLDPYGSRLMCLVRLSWMYSLYAAETYETFHWESGMRYQVSSSPILSTNWAFSLPPYPHSYPQDSRERAYRSWARLAPDGLCSGMDRRGPTSYRTAGRADDPPD